MTSFIWNDEARRLSDALGPLADKVRVRNLHWITTPEGTYLSDNGFCWCRDCATFKVRNLRRRNRKHAREYPKDFLVDGGWGGSEDGPQFCCGCGVRLRHSLTSYGCEDELWHFSESELRPGSEADAYEIREILNALECTSEDDAESQKMVAEAIALASRFLEASSLPLPPPPVEEK